MGAWIEIVTETYLVPMSTVAPLVGAWIEMLDVDSAIAAEIQSLPLWERGLK